MSSNTSQAFLFTLLIFCGVAGAADNFPPDQVELDTPSYTVTIIERCQHADMLCDNVTYVGVNKRTKSKITLRGSKAVRFCSDGVTPCEDIGYEFISGDILYAIRPDGRLIVTNTKSGKTLVEEQGKWIYK